MEELSVIVAFIWKVNVGQDCLWKTVLKVTLLQKYSPRGGLEYSWGLSTTRSEILPIGKEFELRK